VVFPELALHQLQHLLPEQLAAQAPAAPQRLDLFLVRLLQPTGLHLPLEFLPPCRRVLLNTVLTQQAVNPHSAGPVLRCRQIPTKAAPRVGQQSLIRAPQVRLHWVEMHVIERRLR